MRHATNDFPINKKEVTAEAPPLPSDHNASRNTETAPNVKGQHPTTIQALNDNTNHNVKTCNSQNYHDRPYSVPYHKVT